MLITHFLFGPNRPRELILFTCTAAVDVLLQAATSASQGIQDWLGFFCLTTVDVKHDLEATAGQLAANVVKVLLDKRGRQRKGAGGDRMMQLHIGFGKV